MRICRNRSGVDVGQRDLDRCRVLGNDGAVGRRIRGTRLAENCDSSDSDIRRSAVAIAGHVELGAGLHVVELVADVTGAGDKGQCRTIEIERGDRRVEQVDRVADTEVGNRAGQA